MADYISREEVISLIEKGMVTESSYVAKIFNKVLETLIEAVRIVPAADVVEVRHGHFRKIPMACYGGGTITEYECSECGEHQVADSPYCPNCGADTRASKNV